MSNNTLKYKHYVATVEYDSEDKILRGIVLGIKDRIVFYATDVGSLEKEFHVSIDDYLAYCKKSGKHPDKAYSGSIALRVPPELHREVDLRSNAEGISQSAWIASAIKKKISSGNCCDNDMCRQIHNAFFSQAGSTRVIDTYGEQRPHQQWSLEKSTIIESIQ